MGVMFSILACILDHVSFGLLMWNDNSWKPASRLREAAYEKAEGEKILQIKQAEAEAKSKYLAGLGIARQRQAIVEGLKESVLGFSNSVPGASSKDIMDMILITQYFDTMRR